MRSLSLENAVLVVHRDVIGHGDRGGRRRRRDVLELLESRLQPHSLRLVQPELLEVQIPHLCGPSLSSPAGAVRAAGAAATGREETSETTNRLVGVESLTAIRFCFKCIPSARTALQKLEAL